MVSAQLGGDSIFGALTGQSTSAAPGSIRQQRYAMWNRPEGNYNLIFVGDELVEIHSMPS